MNMTKIVPMKLGTGVVRPNILMLIVDDLRPALGVFGDTVAITPNIDTLGMQGVVFGNTFAQQALCGPSRTSFLTSRRPDSTKLYDVHSYWRKSAGNFTTIPQFFKENGYFAYSIGKVFHPGIVSNNSDDFPLSWSTPAFHPSTQKYKMAKVCPGAAGGEPRMNLVCPVHVADQPEATLPDIQSAEHAIHFLETYNQSQPFFLAVGFHKPHIPLKFPWEYLDLYRLDSMGLAPNRKLPQKLPPVAWNPWTDLRERDDVKDLNVSFPFGPLPDYFQKLIRQGYYAATSYMDDLIGKVLHALHETRAADNTIVLFTGDHGWSLGEHQEWSKYSNFEVALKVPLVIRPVGNFYRKFTYVSPLYYIENDILLRGNRDAIPVRDNTDFDFASVKTYRDEFVELVDIFPTLVEMAGFESLIQCPRTLPSPNLCTEGTSVAGFVRKVPVNISQWKTAVFSQYPRPSLFPQENSDQPKVKDVKVMGYTMRTEKYRYTEWVDFDARHLVANFSKVFARELYLKRKDMDEDNNVLGRYKYRKVVRKLAKMLRAGWRNCLPSGWEMHGH